MSNTNVIVIGGNLVADPELKDLKSGTNLTVVRLASSQKFRIQDGELKDDTTFVDVELWGKNAENAAAILKKGDEVTITGRLKMDSWENNEGQKRSRHLIHGTTFQKHYKNYKTEEAKQETQDSPEPVGAGVGNDGEDIPF